MDGPRGADVLYRIGVAKEWLTLGLTVEILLPRNLACARCEGGGCDACGRSGAISLRERTAPNEPLTISLPQQAELREEEGPTLMLRVPNCGGVGALGEARGLLLLSIFAAGESDANVRLVGADSAWDENELQADGSEEIPSYRSRAAMIIILGIAAWAAFYFMLRLAQLV